MPYIITCICNIAMFYMMHYMFANPDLMTVPGGDILKVILALGVIVIGIFSMIFLCYSNSFLIKRRKKEFGLYNVLGMEKRHIRKTMRWEMVFVVIFSYMLGFSLGILGSKLLFLFLLKLLRVPARFGFQVSMSSIVGTIVWFLMIFVITLVINMRQIRLANPMELLRGGSVGEKEPKAKLLLVLIGTVTLGGGYYIALTTSNPLDALGLFFVAVILVMIGTYCLFTAGSIAVLKLMKWKKSFYYQARHFTSVSGMMYRMKQNAVGLANICILSTGVLIMISGTVSMYAGMDDCINERYPLDVSYQVRGEKRELAMENLWKVAEDCAKDYGFSLENVEKYQALTVTAFRNGGKFDFYSLGESVDKGADVNVFDAAVISIMSLEDYNQLMGEEKTLEKGTDIFLYKNNTDFDGSAIKIGDKTYEIKEMLTDCPYEGEMSTYVAEGYYMVVKDMSALKELEQLQREIYQENASNIQSFLSFDLAGSGQDKEACEMEMKKRQLSMMEEKLPEGGAGIGSDYKELEYSDFYAIYGGLFFLGIFLGILFLMGTALIIYYKQVSEGYDDRERFEIMQKVGMSRKEVRRSIRSQVLMVFFLPLIMACIHMAVAFPMVTKLLSTLQMRNVSLFAVCTVLCVGAFALVYGAIYTITARMYDKIVRL